MSLWPYYHVAMREQAPAEKLFFLIFFRACCNDATAATVFLWKKFHELADRVWHCGFSCTCLAPPQNGCFRTSNAKSVKHTGDSGSTEDMLRLLRASWDVRPNFCGYGPRAMPWNCKAGSCAAGLPCLSCIVSKKGFYALKLLFMCCLGR